MKLQVRSSKFLCQRSFTGLSWLGKPSRKAQDNIFEMGLEKTLPGRINMSLKQNLLKLFSAIAIAAMLFSVLQPASAFAQSGDGLKRQLNAESGKVSFLGPESGRFLSASKVLGAFLRPQDPAMALAKRFAPE